MFAGRRPSPDQLRDYYDGYGLHDVDSPITRVRYGEILDTFEPYRRTNRLLDVGCGQGRFLEVAQSRGWEVSGTEYTETQVLDGRAKGFDMTLAPARVGDLPSAAFDVVCAFEVLEHVTDPKAEAEVLADVVRDGGLLYVTTPNFDSLSRRVLGADWNVIAYPEHLGYFTARSLRRWLETAGFAVVSIETTGTSPGRLVRSLRGRRGTAGADQPVGGAPDEERLRGTIESSGGLRAAKRAVNSALTATRTGDTLKARFERRRHRSA